MDHCRKCVAVVYDGVEKHSMYQFSIQSKTVFCMLPGLNILCTSFAYIVIWSNCSELLQELVTQWIWESKGNVLKWCRPDTGKSWNCRLSSASAVHTCNHNNVHVAVFDRWYHTNVTMSNDIHYVTEQPVNHAYSLYTTTCRIMFQR